MRRRRVVSIALTTSTQRLEFVRIVSRPTWSLAIERRVAHLYALQAQLAPESPVLVVQTAYNVQSDQYRVVAHVNHAPSLAREPTMTKRHARVVVPGLSRALTTLRVSHAPTCRGRNSACLALSARSVRARLRRWMLPGRVVLRARRGRSLTQRRRGVSTALTIDIQHLEFVKTAYHPTWSLGIEVHAIDHLNAPLLPSAWTPLAVAMQTQVSHNVQHAFPGL